MARGTRSKVATRAIDTLDDQFSKCPRGHSLPHAVEGNGSCSPIRCAKDGLKSQELAETRKAVKDAEEASALDRTEAVKEAQITRVQMQRSIAREIARKRLVPMPEGLSGADAEAYVERKLVELSVDAVAELEYQLKYGTDDQRTRAAERVLESTGHGKKERVGGATNLIIVQGIMANAALPWAKPPIGALPVNAVPVGTK